MWRESSVGLKLTFSDWYWAEYYWWDIVGITNHDNIIDWCPALIKSRLNLKNKCISIGRTWGNSSSEGEKNTRLDKSDLDKYSLSLNFFNWETLQNITKTLASVEETLKGVALT